ncbi:MAG: hypothetical protein FWG92_07605 [Leptospirales bacterium]|nr:hypothetical protein [Leptospirales bacterium]
MEYAEIEKLTEKVKQENTFVRQIKDEMAKVIIGQQHLIDCVIISFMTGGHILL